MDDYGRDQIFGDGILQAYRDDTDRRGIYTLGDGANIEGRVDWFVRSSGIIYQDSSDTYRLAPSNGYISVFAYLFENKYNGTLSVGNTIRLSSIGQTDHFFLPPSTEYQYITVEDAFNSPTNYVFGYLIGISHYDTPSASFVNNPAEPVYEGETINLLLNTQNIPAGAILYYSISSGDSSRFYGGVSGYVTAGENNQTKISITTVDNGFVNNDERLTLTLHKDLASTTFTLKDKIKLQQYSFESYSSDMNEGQSNSLLIKTTSVNPGTVLNYSISGITADRLTSGSLQGTTTVDYNGQARIDLGVLANNRTDGPTTAVVTVGNNLASASVLINDTSLTPTITPKYSFIEYSSWMNEGVSNGMVVQTTGVRPGTVLNYSISGITADRLTSGSLQETTTVDSNGQARIDLGVLANNRTDGLTTAVVTVGNNLASASVVINDTSLTPTITSKYSFIEYSSQMNEGQTNGLLIQTTSVTPGTVLNYSISGITADRLISGSLVGSTTVDTNGQARIDFGVVANNRTDGITTASIKLGNNLAIASVVVNDTSMTPVGKPTYSFIEYSSSINEGQSNGLLIQTTSVTPGTVLNYSISGITADRISSGSLQGSTTVDSNGQARIDIGVLANNRTDGSNTASVVVGNNLASISFEIIDTSMTQIDSEIILSDNVNPFMVITPNLKINGTSLVDKVVMPLDSSSILINSEGSQITVVDSSGILGNTTLTNIERIYFNDISLAFDTTGVAGQAYRIYEAVLGRAPDLGGLGYWINDMDNGVSLTTIAAGFIASKEFKDKYGTNPSFDTYVNLLYQNILGRAPDAEGLNYWVTNMQNGIDTPAAVLASFSEGYENKGNVAPDIANGIYYTPWIN